MRHQKAGKKLSRTSSHRKAMYSNMVASLVIHERIETTDVKAKELKRLADRTISWGTSVGDLTAKGRDKLDAAERAQIVHAKRMARRVVKSEEALEKLFSDVAPRYRGRSGGYTRVLKTRVRRGDAAPMSFVELVPVGAPEKKEPKAPKGGEGKPKAEKAEAKPEGEAPAKKPRKKKSEPQQEA
jgi:large subunit ribosomal protein L17